MGTAGTTQWGDAEVSDRSAGFGKAPLSQFPKAPVTKSQSIPNNLRVAWKKPLGWFRSARRGGARFPGLPPGREPGLRSAAQRFCFVIKLLSRYGLALTTPHGRGAQPAPDWSGIAAAGARLRPGRQRVPGGWRRGVFNRFLEGVDAVRRAARESVSPTARRGMPSTQPVVTAHAVRLDFGGGGWHERPSSKALAPVQSSDP